MSVQKEKGFLFGQEVREKLLQGLKAAFDAVKHTFGPQSRHTLFEKKFGPPQAVRGGYKIISELQLQDPEKDAGLSLVKDAMEKMYREVHDGTTSAIILTYLLAKEIHRYLAVGEKPIILKRSLDKARDRFLTVLKDSAIKVEVGEEVGRIATSLGKGSSHVGQLIYEAIAKVGKEGVILIDENRSDVTKLEFVEGLQIESGLLSPYFATDALRGVAELENVRILITDQKIASPQEILSILQSIAVSKESLLLIAGEIESETVATLIINKMQGGLEVCAVKAPFDRDLLEDIALATGGVFVSEEKGMSLKNSDSAVLGFAKRVVVSKREVLIIEGRGRGLDLSSHVCKILVGGKTELEMKEEKERFDEALLGTKAILKEGGIVGGGIGLLFAISSIDEKELPLEEVIGMTILKKSIRGLVRTLVENSAVEPEPVLEKVLAKGLPYGFNSDTRTIDNLLSLGIIDPYQVASLGIGYAVSTAGLFVLSEAMILETGEV
jgi:chaperonin GroEL